MSRANKMARKRRVRAQLKAAVRSNQGINAARRLGRAQRLKLQQAEEQARLRSDEADRLERERRRHRAEDYRMKRSRDSLLTPGPAAEKQPPRPGEIVGAQVCPDGKIRLVRKPVSHPRPDPTDATLRELHDRQLDAAIESLRRTSPQSPGSSS